MNGALTTPALVVMTPEELDARILDAVRRALAEARPANDTTDWIVTTKAAAKLVGLSTKTFLKRRKEGRIPSHEPEPGEFRYRRSELEAYMATKDQR